MNKIYYCLKLIVVNLFFFRKKFKKFKNAKIVPKNVFVKICLTVSKKSKKFNCSWKKVLDISVF